MAGFRIIRGLDSADEAELPFGRDERETALSRKDWYDEKRPEPDHVSLNAS